jgi:hypothetical protein
VKDTVLLIESDLKAAIAAHNEAVSRLYLPTGGPRYSDEVMRQEGQKARQALTNALDNLHNRAEDIRTTAATTAAAARDDPYSWLNDDELQRAALLAPFVAEDVARADAVELATLGNQVMTGRRTLPRPMAWLLMRAAAARDGVPGAAVRAFETAAMPPDVAAADKLANDADLVQRTIDRNRPEWKERIDGMVQRRAVDVTGQVAELR